SGDQRRRLRPQGPRHLLDRRAVVRAADDRAGPSVPDRQLLLQEIVTSPRGPRRSLDARTARLAAADLLSRRAWTTRELTTRLRRRGAPPDVADAVVADLTARGYLDDEAFAATGSPRERRAATARRACAQSSGRAAWPP